MDKESTEDRAAVMNTVIDIFRDVFNDNGLNITEASNADEIDDWDSLTHVELIMKIEKSFGVRFALGELEKMKNVGDLLSVLMSKI